MTGGRRSLRQAAGRHASCGGKTSTSHAARSGGVQSSTRRGRSGSCRCRSRSLRNSSSSARGSARSLDGSSLVSASPTSRWIATLRQMAPRCGEGGQAPEARRRALAPVSSEVGNGAKASLAQGRCRGGRVEGHEDVARLLSAAGCGHAVSSDERAEEDARRSARLRLTWPPRPLMQVRGLENGTTNSTTVF